MAFKRYTGILAKPLRPYETPESKLPALKDALRVATDRDALIVLLVRHVIGQRASCGYPLTLRGAPKRGASPSDRLPALFAYVGATTEREALIAMAERHVPGFKPGRKGGRPPSGGIRPFDAKLQAHVAQIWEAIDDRLGQPGLTVQECAEQISVAPNLPDHSTNVSSFANPFFNVEPKKIVEAYNHRKRGNQQSVTELEDLIRSASDIFAGPKPSGKP